MQLKLKLSKNIMPTEILFYWCIKINLLAVTQDNEMNMDKALTEPLLSLQGKHSCILFAYVTDYSTRNFLETKLDYLCKTI